MAASGTPSPSLRHRRLTREVRRLREESGLTRDEAAAAMEWKPSKVTRIETGRWTRLQPRDLRDMCGAYGVDKETCDYYIQLAKEALEKGWWTKYADVATTYVGFEDEASAIQSFEPTYIPGLLQTAGYARALAEVIPKVTPEVVEQRVAMRMERQQLLHGKNAPEFWAVVDEQALRRPVGGREVMREQLGHLLERMAEPHIDVQVVPLAVGAHPGLDGSFVLLTFPDPVDQPVVFLETATDGRYLEEPEELHRYTLRFNHLRAAALPMKDTAALIEDVMADL